MIYWREYLYNSIIHNFSTKFVWTQVSGRWVAFITTLPDSTVLGVFQDITSTNDVKIIYVSFSFIDHFEII